MSDASAASPIRDSPPFRRLLLARAVSHIGDGVAITALVLLVQGTHRSGPAVGALLLATSVPRFLGPLAGVLVDRVEQRSVMVACDLGQAALFGVIAWLAPPFGWLLVLVVAAATLDTVFAPAGRSAVPALVRPAQLLRANALLSTAMNLRIALGPVLGGLLVAGLGVRGALAANALTFVISAAALIGLPALRSVGETEARGFLAVGVEGLRFVWRSPLLRALAISLFLGVAFAGLDDVSLVFLVRETLHGDAVAFGLVSGAYGVGMLAGSLGLSWKGTAAGAAAVFAWGWVASSGGAIVTGLAPLLAVAAVGQAIAGLGNALEVVATDTMVQQATPREMLGRVFGLIGTASYTGHTLAFAGGGFLLEVTSARTVFVIAGLGTMLVLGPVLLVLRRTR